MRKKTCTIFFLWLLFFAAPEADAQSNRLPLTADSLATGNFKDVFRSFFQLAFDRFTSDRKEIQFTSNPFAVMAKMNPELLVDTNYVRYTNLRRLNFSFAVALDTSYRFDGFSSGIRYALINQRDETISRAFVIAAFNANAEFNQLNDALERLLSIIPASDPRRALFREQKTKMFRGELTFDQLDPSFQTAVREQAEAVQAFNFLRLLKQNPRLNILRTSNQRYDSLRTLFQKGLLWTVGLSDTTYRDQFLFSNVVLSTELLQGISNPLQPVGLELNVTGTVNFSDDLRKNGRDLQRSILRLQPGINLFFKTAKSQYPWAEIKMSGSYHQVLNGRYPNEDQSQLILNTTLRVRIFNDIWIPLEINYDPDSGNVFGFLNIRANFTGLKNWAKTMTGQ